MRSSIDNASRTLVHFALNPRHSTRMAASILWPLPLQIRVLLLPLLIELQARSVLLLPSRYRHFPGKSANPPPLTASSSTSRRRQLLLCRHVQLPLVPDIRCRPVVVHHRPGSVVVARPLLSNPPPATGVIAVGIVLLGKCIPGGTAL